MCADVFVGLDCLLLSKGASSARGGPLDLVDVTVVVVFLLFCVKGFLVNQWGLKIYAADPRQRIF